MRVLKDFQTKQIITIQFCVHFLYKIKFKMLLCLFAKKKNNRLTQGSQFKILFFQVWYQNRRREENKLQERLAKQYNQTIYTNFKQTNQITDTNVKQSKNVQTRSTQTIQSIQTHPIQNNRNSYSYSTQSTQTTLQLTS